MGWRVGCVGVGVPRRINLLTATRLKETRVLPRTPNNRERALLMPTIVEGVDFDTVAREWRCKWSADNDKASLAAAQALLVKTKPDIAAVKGVKEVKRIVCGGCLDFKVIIALDAAVYGDWEAQVNEVSSVTPITAHQMLNSPLPVRQEFAPEKAFLEALGSIPGISNVETQTFTITTAGDANERDESILGRMVNRNEAVGDVEKTPGLTISRNHDAATLI